MNNVRIDIRPHYTFAFYLESMVFGNKSLLYYSRKDGSLHIKHVASKYDCGYDVEEDKEYTIAISNNNAFLLEKAFGAMVDAYNTYINYFGEPWYICDGSVCLVICGKKRVRFETPCPDDTLDSFCVMAYNLLSDEQDYKEILKSVPQIIDALEKYASKRPPFSEVVSEYNDENDIPEAL